jgi:hypothetical protein
LSSLHRIIVSFLLLILSSPSAGSDPFRITAGAREAGMGQVCIMNSSFWSSFRNQATLALNRSAAFGFSYENRFGLKELGTRSTALVIPAGKASVGAVYSRFGYTDFRRDMAGVACGIQLGEKIMAGVQADYMSEKTYGEYINNEFITFEAGILILASESVRIGLHLFNPVPSALRKIQLPQRLRAGAGIDLGKSLFAGAEAEMSTGGKLIVRTGCEYEPARNFFLRGGFSTENSSFSFGLGYILKPMHLDIGFATHERLGVTSSASVRFTIK